MRKMGIGVKQKPDQLLSKNLILGSFIDLYWMFSVHTTKDNPDFAEWMSDFTFRFSNCGESINRSRFESIISVSINQVYSFAGTKREYMIGFCERVIYRLEERITGENKVCSEIWSKWKDSDVFWFNFNRKHVR